MKMHTESELETIMQTEFQKGFEACRLAAVAVCRQRHGDPDEYRQKTATECANEIARLVCPRQKFKDPETT